MGDDASAQHAQKKSERYLAFVDYLGTRELYREAEANFTLIEDRRYEIEHAIHFRLQRRIAERKIEIGVFSDTVLIAGHSLHEVLASTATLLDSSLQKTLARNNANDIRLLRAGVARGLELRAGYLRPSPGVSVIPFFDSSIAFAFEMEDVRRGSRVFLGGQIVPSELEQWSKYLFAWGQMTGHGRPMIDVHEFLWPAALHAADVSTLSKLLSDCFQFWRRVERERALEVDAYRATLYHLDETIKVVIRSFVSLGVQENPGAFDVLVQRLPSPSDPMNDVNIRYLWGVWFQVAYVLVRLGLTDKYAQQLEFMVRELKRRGYWDKFVAEIDVPDYGVMRALFATPAFRT